MFTFISLAAFIWLRHLFISCNMLFDPTFALLMGHLFCGWKSHCWDLLSAEWLLYWQIVCFGDPSLDLVVFSNTFRWKIVAFFITKLGLLSSDKVKDYIFRVIYNLQSMVCFYRYCYWLVWSWFVLAREELVAASNQVYTGSVWCPGWCTTLVHSNAQDPPSYAAQPPSYWHAD